MTQFSPDQALAAAKQHHQAGRLRDAETLYRQVLAAQPNNHEALNHLGILAFQCGASEPALDLINRSIALDPTIAYYHRNHAEVLRKLARYADAETAIRKAIQLQPGIAPDMLCLGLICEKTGRIPQAVEHYRQAIQLVPNFAEALFNLGVLEEQQAGYDESLALFDRAIAARPNYALARLSRATALLRLGRYEQGWPEYEWRWGVSQFAVRRPQPPIPVWDGSDPRGLAIVIRFEQGMGDTLQFIRYAPLVARRGASVILEVQPPLKSLLARIEGVAQTIAHAQPLPQHDFQVPLMSLPRVFNTTVQTIPAAVPYITPDPARVEAWRARISNDNTLKAGLVWAGNPIYPNDKKRSIRLETYAPLTKVAGVTFYSIQKGDPAADTKTPPPGMNLVDLTNDLADFADTAALLSHLGLVISVDTAVAHLAGAMAKPVWILVPFVPDFRWLLFRGDTPWYPTMKLYRQSTLDDWPPVITRLANDLQSLAATCR